MARRRGGIGCRGGQSLLKRDPQTRFVAVEGPTGAGKSTLVGRLPNWLGGDAIFDPFDANPFFGAVHEDAAAHYPARLELLSELTFLTLRIAQLREIATILAAGRSVVADWALVKQPIFAGLALGEADRNRIVRTCAIWADDLPDPDLLIYLRADARTLLERIAGRGREIEVNLNETYLTSLCNAFDSELAHYSGQVLVVDATTFDVFDDDIVAQLAARVRQTPVQGDGACCA